MFLNEFTVSFDTWNALSHRALGMREHIRQQADSAGSPLFDLGVTFYANIPAPSLRCRS